MKKKYAIANFLVILAVIIWNYLANSLGIKGNTVASLSSEYFNLFTPAGYAFGIWGLIYLGLLGHGIYQLKKAVFDKKEDDFIIQIGPWLIVANLANALWLLFWLLEFTGISVLMMFIILISLLVIIVRLNMEKEVARIGILFWVWWPICIYSGWIVVASIANVAAWLTKAGWEPAWGEISWTIIMILVAMLINIYMIMSRNMREFAIVGIWALIAISVRHWDSVPLLQWTALVSAVIILIFIAVNGYRNHESNEIFGLLKPSGVKNENG